MADVEIDVEMLVADLERVTAERDEYLALAQAKQAEFENFRKRMTKQQADELARASSKLVEGLLPCSTRSTTASPTATSRSLPMRGAAARRPRAGGPRRGSTRPASRSTRTSTRPWPTSPATAASAVVAEALRAGYRWQGHLLRPVMVRVRD